MNNYLITKIIILLYVIATMIIILLVADWTLNIKFAVIMGLAGWVFIYFVIMDTIRPVDIIGL